MGRTDDVEREYAALLAEHDEALSAYNRAQDVLEEAEIRYYAANDALSEADRAQR